MEIKDLSWIIVINIFPWIKIRPQTKGKDFCGDNNEADKAPGRRASSMYRSAHLQEVRSRRLMY
jgi:hypothetical protein